MKISNIFYLCLLLFFKANCFDVPPQLQQVCPQGCKRYFYCDEQQKKCVYKGFFPIYPLEFLEILILMTSSSLATSCGIGGGAVYSSMILGVEEFEPSEAFPIANFLILLCGIITYISFALDKIEHPKNIFVHYDIATVFGPSMLLGAKFGTILNKILSSTILLILLLFLLIYTCSKTYKNILKAKAREKKLLEKKEAGQDLRQPLLEKESNEENLDTSLDKEEIERREFIKEEEYPLNWTSINFLLLMELLVIIDQLIEGSNRIPSFVGIQRCSFWFWFTFGVYVVVTLISVKFAISYVLKRVRRKKELLPDYNSEVMENVENRIAYIVCIGIFAGIVSSSLGIGGGMITNPVFSGLGMDPKQSSSTSNFLIIVTAIASCFIFVLSGQLKIEYSLCMGALCTVAAWVGSFFILKYINRTGKSSILLVIMEYFLIASFFIALYKLITNDTKGYSFLGSIFALNNYC